MRSPSGWGRVTLGQMGSCRMHDDHGAQGSRQGRVDHQRAQGSVQDGYQPFLCRSCPTTLQKHVDRVREQVRHKGVRVLSLSTSPTSTSEGHWPIDASVRTNPFWAFCRGMAMEFLSLPALRMSRRATLFVAQAHVIGRTLLVSECTDRPVASAGAR